MRDDRHSDVADRQLLSPDRCKGSLGIRDLNAFKEKSEAVGVFLVIGVAFLVFFADGQE